MCKCERNMIDNVNSLQCLLCEMFNVIVHSLRGACIFLKTLITSYFNVMNHCFNLCEEPLSEIPLVFIPLLDLRSRGRQIKNKENLTYPEYRR